MQPVDTVGAQKPTMLELHPPDGAVAVLPVSAPLQSKFD